MRGQTSLHLLLNGRFLGRQLTGVDRTALNLGRSLAQIAKADEAGSLRLDVTVPADAPSDQEIRMQLGLGKDARILRSTLKGYAWEQLVLPFQMSDAVLLNLCNMGPALRRRQLVLMHDAQVFDAPESYSAAFRTTYRLLLPWIARHSLLLATVSNHSRERLTANGVGNDEDFSIIYNGVSHLDEVAADPSIIDRAGLVRNEYLLTLGSAAPHKNLATLLAALPESGPTLAIAGGGEAVAELVANAGVRNVVHLGRVTDGELKALYSDAMIFLFPSLTEGFGFPPLEAMACGCPTIVSRGGALPEVCGNAAIYCDPLDVPGWQSMIEQLVASPALRDQLIGLGKDHVVRFSWTTSAREFVQLARQALDRENAATDRPSQSGIAQHSIGTGEQKW